MVFKKTSWIILAACTALAGLNCQPKTVAPVEDRVDVGGYQLNFVVTPGTAPAVIFESGAGCDSSLWDKVQIPVAQATGAQTVSYDRAGYGKSDWGNPDYDIERDVEALHSGLVKLAVRGDIILVAHSYGGFLARLYAGKYPAGVRGIVLLDPNNIPFYSTKVLEEMLKEIRDSPPQNVSLADARVMNVYEATVDKVQRSPDYPAGVPLTIIRSGKQMWPTADRQAAWDRSMETIVATAPNRQLLVAEGSSHMIPTDRPDMVIEIVVGMVKKAPVAHTIVR
jgi:pimeloyl-ACP methyl ester carboxylesterase